MSAITEKDSAEILEFVARATTPHEILNYRPSEHFECRVRELLEKSKSGNLDTQEEQEWERYEFVEHLVRMAKAKAYLELDDAHSPGLC